MDSNLYLLPSLTSCVPLGYLLILHEFLPNKNTSPSLSDLRM